MGITEILGLSRLIFSGNMFLSCRKAGIQLSFVLHNKSDGHPFHLERKVNQGSRIASFIALMKGFMM